MKKLMTLLCVLALAGCGVTPPVQSPSTIPVLAPVCATINSDKFDLALRAYGVAVDAINLLVDRGALVPGTAKARAVANANDKVLAGFALAESARRACNATSYAAALAQAQTGITEVKAALRL